MKPNKQLIKEAGLEGKPNKEHDEACIEHNIDKELGECICEEIKEDELEGEEVFIKDGDGKVNFDGYYAYPRELVLAVLRKNEENKIIYQNEHSYQNKIILWLEDYLDILVKSNEIWRLNQQELAYCILDRLKERFERER